MQGMMRCMLYCYFLFFVCVAFALGTSSLFFQEAKAKNDNSSPDPPFINLKKIMTFFGDKFKFPNFHCFEIIHSSAGINPVPGSVSGLGMAGTPVSLLVLSFMDILTLLKTGSCSSSVSVHWDFVSRRYSPISTWMSNKLSVYLLTYLIYLGHFHMANSKSFVFN